MELAKKLLLMVVAVAFLSGCLEGNAVRSPNTPFNLQVTTEVGNITTQDINAGGFGITGQNARIDANSTDLIFSDPNFPVFVTLQDLYDTNGSGGGGGDTNGIAGYAASFDNGDLTNGVYSINHNLDTNDHITRVYDDGGYSIFPDQTEIITVNRIDLNISSFVPINGTWRVIVLARQSGEGNTKNLTFVNGDLNGSGEIVLSHDLGKVHVQVEIANDAGEQVFIDSVTFVNDTNAILDLSSFQPLAGTYTAVFTE